MPPGQAPIATQPWTHPHLPITYQIQEVWEPLFDRQVDQIRSDIRRNRDEDKLIVYLSCPISARGGGFHGTNLEVAAYTAQRVAAHWGIRCWVLNPGQYQMESNEGRRLMDRHLQELNGTPNGQAFLKAHLGRRYKPQSVSVDNLPPPQGGDYMRMWTTVLAGDDGFGDDFDFFYFLSPTDAWEFLTLGGARTVTAGVEEYFAQKNTVKDEYAEWFGGRSPAPPAPGPAPTDADYEKRRKDFFRFYAVRASAAFSKGSHDEWNIWVLINRNRLHRAEIGDQLPGYWEGRQVDPVAAETLIANGYAV